LNLLDSDDEESAKDEAKSETVTDDEGKEGIQQLESLLNKEDKEEISQLFKNIKVSLTEYNQKIIPFSEIAQENNIETVKFNLFRYENTLILREEL
jgi:hypothetical protein